MNTYIISAVLLSVVIFAGGVESLTCYDCHFTGTGSADSCADPFDKIIAHIDVATTKCSGYCSKIVGKVGNMQSVTRSCLPVCVNVGDDEAGTFCCNSDRCNSAGFLQVSWLSTLLSLGALLFLVARR